MKKRTNLDPPVHGTASAITPAGPNRIRPWLLVGAVTATAAVTGAGLLFWNQAPQDQRIAQAITGGTIADAPAAIRKYGCGGCHTIPAIPGADGKVAAPLDGFRQRVFIAGMIRNTPDHLVAWIVAPQTFSPNSAMPQTGVTEKEARNIAAFLYAH